MLVNVIGALRLQFCMVSIFLSTGSNKIALKLSHKRLK